MPAFNLVSRKENRTTPSTAAVSTRQVLVWRSGSRVELDERLQQWRNEGWRVERCEPRIVEGPAYGALVVLQRVPMGVRSSALDENGRFVLQRWDAPVVPPLPQSNASVHWSKRLFSTGDGA